MLAFAPKAVSADAIALSPALPINAEVVARIRMAAGAGAVLYAVQQLFNGIDWVMDPENNRAKSKAETIYCSHNGSPCVDNVSDAEKYALQTDFHTHWKYPLKGCQLVPNGVISSIDCVFEKDGDIRVVVFF